LTKVSDSSKRIREQIKNYVRGNWGIPLIVVFMLLLPVASICLVTPNFYASIVTSVADEKIATFLLISLNLVSCVESIASCTCIVLIVGVLLQLGKVNSDSTRKIIAQIKGLNLISKSVRFGKNRFSKGAVFHGSD